MDEDRFNQLKTVMLQLRELRRRYNEQLKSVAEGTLTNYNGEDLARLVGTLEAAYNHCLASLASDGDIYCLLKHISYAIILAGEMDIPDTEELYEIMTIISDGRIEPCSSCRREETMDNIKEKEEGARNE